MFFRPQSCHLFLEFLVLKKTITVLPCSYPRNSNLFSTMNLFIEKIKYIAIFVINLHKFMKKYRPKFSFQS